MKLLIQIVLLISGFLPSTYLFMLCVTFLLSDSNIVGLISFLGILGYVGIFLLFFEHCINNWLIMIFLLSGVISFLIFTSMLKLNFWNLITNIDNDWFLFVWPNIVVSYNILRLLTKNSALLTSLKS